MNETQRERARRASAEWRARNQQQVNESRRDHYARNKERLRAEWRKRYATDEEFKAKHRGESLSGYYRASIPRPDECEVCGRDGPICYDHCHAGGHFRGWLCNRCNVVLGHIGDDPDLLRKLADYLERGGK